MSEDENTTGRTKLIQYLTEAHGKEKELETSLAAHIAIANRAAYRERLEAHLEETTGHARLVRERLEALGGDAGGTSIPGVLAGLASRAVATAKGPLHVIRGTGPEEKELKNAKTEYSEEHEEIATYLAIETLATELGDEETAKVAKRIRADEERMASFLEKQIPVLTRAVAKAEIPTEQRTGSARTGSRRSSSKRSATTA